MRLWVGVVAIGMAGCHCHGGVVPPGAVRMDGSVVESSGLAVASPGGVWTHGDSGGKAELIGVGTDGAVRSRVRVRGAFAVDWEDLARDDSGHLWIADTGNNANARRDLTVYRVPEPGPGAEEVTVDRVVKWSFPDQTAFPEAGRLNFDAEALWWWDGTLWLASKHRSDTKSTLYRFGALEGDVVLERRGEIDVGGEALRFGGMVTAGDVDPSGRLALLTYHALLVFPPPAAGATWFDAEPHVVTFDMRTMGQCEAVAWDGDAVWVTNEAGVLFRIEDPGGRTAFPR